MVRPGDIQTVVSRVSYPEKVQEVETRSPENRYAYTSHEFEKQTEHNAHSVVHTPKSEQTGLDREHRLKERREEMEKERERRRKERQQAFAAKHSDQKETTETPKAGTPAKKGHIDMKV